MAFPRNSPNGPVLVSSECLVLPAVPQPEQQPFYKTFLKGQPKALGTVQITLGILHIALGVVLVSTSYPGITFISGVPFWGTIFYVIAGSLSVGAENKQSRCLVRGSLALNIISCFVSLLEIILIIVDFIIYFPMYYCNDYDYSCSDYNRMVPIRNTCLVFLLIISLLQFCVSMSLSAFGCRSLNHQSIQQTPVYVINSNYHVTMGPGAFPSGPDNQNITTIDLSSKATPIPPDTKPE
ncbi:membrane-spanning 4-domains subfamily A member 8-like [Discoglossus pictus]